jgi:protein-tyrosine phosphatase
VDNLSHRIILQDAPPDVNHIDGNLYLGSLPSSVAKFKYVVNVMFHRGEVLPYTHEVGQIVLLAPFFDHAEMPEDPEFLRYVVEQAAYFVGRGPTLIHCRGGVNRSALIAALVLMKRGRTPEEAINLLRIQRGDFVLANATFVKHIKSLGLVPRGIDPNDHPSDY